ncbi:MAG: hypothetical protein J6N51_10310, partial [Selenomonas sp.]|nr:hypothetical protein [Selenomonas sp.]
TSLIATAGGNDEISLGKATNLTVNVGNGADSVTLGDGETVKNVNIIGGTGDKTINIIGDLDPSNVTLTGGGNDVVNIDGALLDSTISTGAGRDSIGANSSKGSVINAGAGDDSVVIREDADRTFVDLGDGRDSLTINGEVKNSTLVGGAGDDSIVITGGSSTANISLGAGNDSVQIAALAKDTSIYGGAGADVVVLGNGGQYSYVDLGDGADSIQLAGAYKEFSITGGNGKDTFNFTDATGNITITNYDVNTDLIVGSAPADTDVDEYGNVTLGGAVVNVSKTGDYYAVQTDDGYTAWGDEDGSVIDLHTIGWNEVTTIYGGANDDAGDKIIGGKKADSIILGANDSVNGGLGNDSIVMTSGNKTQEYVALANGNGSDEVTGFTTTTTYGVDGDEADVLYLYENHLSSLKLEAVTGGLAAKVGSGSVSLDGLLSGTSATNEVLNVKDNTGKTYEVDFVVGTENVTGSTDELADVYYAGTSAAALDFGAVDSALVVDLANRGLNFNGSSLTNTDGAYYYGNFTSVTGGSDNTVLMGAGNVKESLQAGNGDATLWGGGTKADSLAHGSGTNNTVTFIFGDGDGKDTISGNWGNSDTSDVLWLGSSAIKAIKNNGTDTTITVNDGSKATLAGVGSTMTDQVVKFTTDNVNIQQAKIGVTGASNSWTYDADVDFYIGGSKNTLNVTSSVDDAIVWADGTNKFENVTTIDARGNSGALVLAGGSLNETIYAGAGNSSVWGGSEGNDVLVGNATGTTDFYFGNGNGSDVITNSTSDDKVVLYNVALGDIASIDVTKSDSMVIGLKDGSSLTVNSVSTGANNFQLGDGSAYSYDASTGNWTRTK